MPAYVIVDIEIHDLEGYAEYKQLAPETVAALMGNILREAVPWRYWKGSGLPTVW